MRPESVTITDLLLGPRSSRYGATECPRRDNPDMILLSVEACSGGHLLQNMDMSSLLAWRASCRLNYAAVTNTFHTMRYDIIAQFVPDPTSLLTLITQFGALIVGEAALAYICRDPPNFLSTLELSTGNVSFLQFSNCIRDIAASSSIMESSTITTPPPSFTALRHISSIAETQLTSGRRIIVYESDSVSACNVVAGMWTSALMNFVTAHTFGCAYPRLTLASRGLLSRPRLAAVSDHDEYVGRTLKARGFLFSFSSTNWIPSNEIEHLASPMGTVDCGRSLFLCSHQGRFFGDRGSLVIIIDSFSVDRLYLKSRCIAPYGPMVAWRLPNLEPCNHDCLNTDNVLPPNVVSILCRFLEPNRTAHVRRPRQLTFAPANDRLPFTLPPLRPGSRRYSVS